MAEIKDYSTTAGSNNSASPNGMPEGMAPSGVNNSWREQTARIKRWYEDVSAVNSLAGGTTAYTLAASRAISAYAAGDHFVAVCNATNTGAVTLNVDSVGAKSVVTTSQTALAAGQLVVDGIYVFSYDATNDVFIVLNPNLEIQDQTAVTTLAATDELAVHDGALKKITVANARPALHAANGCSFRATLSGDQTITSGSATKVQWDTESFDLGSVYDATTNYVFTAPAAGKYFFVAALAGQGIADADYWDIYINSSAYNSGDPIACQRTYIAAGSAVSAMSSCSVLVDLALNDTIWTEVVHNYGSNRTVLAASSNVQSSFSGMRVA